MKKIRVIAQYGFVGCFHEDEFEFPDDTTDEEIDDEMWDWAAQFVDVEWEEVE